MKALIIIIVAISTICFGQGKISGLVLDSDTGEKLIGVNILIEGTNIGASTDLEGSFEIKNLNAGKYNIKVSYISYQEQKIDNIEVQNGKNTKLNIAMKSQSIELNEVTITGNANFRFEEALINQQKKSLTITDGISAEQIKKSSDNNSADALKRVPGITIMDGKYVFVRGTTERYSQALLNNTILASTEPDKKSFAFDLIPSNLIENTIVIKSFSPEQSGNFGGGLIKMNTVEFPVEKTINFNIGTSFLNNTSTKGYSTYQGGKTDYLGYDDGSRDLPDGFPNDLTKLKSDSIISLAKSLNNIWKPETKKAPFNYNFGFSYGQKFDLGNYSLGVIAALNYHNSTSSSEMIRREFMADTSKRFDYKGMQYENNVFWGALFNTTLKLSNAHKVSLKNSYTVNSDDQVLELNGIQYDKSSEQFNTALRFISRNLLSTQVSGQSYFENLGGLKTDWRGYYSESRRDEPDYRRYTYSRELGSEDRFYINLANDVNPQLGGRFFSKLGEYAKGVALDLMLPVYNMKIKVGSGYDIKNRSFDSRLIGIIKTTNTNFNLLYYAIDSVFAAKNFRTSGFTLQEYINGTNNYSSSEITTSAYFLSENPFILFGESFVSSVGFRFENSVLRLRTMDISNTKELNVDQNNHNILPSFNLVYLLNENINLRIAFSKTIVRPEFREVSPFTYYDFQTQESISGNDTLKQTDILNLDFRFEIFPDLGEIFSFSLFYKEIRNGIEKVVIPISSGESRTFANTPFAKNYGLEIETRTSLKHISSYLEGLTVNINYSYINSILRESIEYAVGQNETRERRLQGQSPYMINFGINYNAKEWGTNITLLYNKIGPRILEVANYMNEDIYEQGRNLIDLTVSQQLYENIVLKVSAKDILGEDQVVKQKNEILRSDSRAVTLSASLNINL